MGHKHKPGRKDLENQVEQLQKDLEMVSTRAYETGMMLNRVCLEIFRHIEQYEKGKVGAKPCILYIKGLLEGFGIWGAVEQQVREAQNKTNQPKEAGDKAEDEGESGPTG